MLETVREFSTTRREEAGETDSVTDRFLAWARDFGVAHHESVYGTDLVSSVERIRAEQDNLLQALRHGLDRRDGATVAATSAVLRGLWAVDSNQARMAPLADDAAWVLSHYRPEPDLVETTRTAAVLATVDAFFIRGAWAMRSLVTVRRLPPAPPDTLTRAMEIVLRALTLAPGPATTALHALCASDNPLLAGIANGVASTVWENDNDLDNAVEAARRTLTAFENRGMPLLTALAHSRMGELCLTIDRGDEALIHVSAALSIVEEVGARATAARLRWAMVLCNLQCGAIDEAEHWLELTVGSGGHESAGLLMIDFGVRAEILLARGQVEAGLHSWRQAADRLRNPEPPTSGSDPLGVELWALEVQAVTVIAHAQHGRLDLVDEVTADLPRLLSRMIRHPIANPPASYGDFGACGALLLALAMVDIDRGERFGDTHAATSGARMIALAERFQFPRGFQPTMSATRARRNAEQADRRAYADAVSSYAGLGRQRPGRGRAGGPAGAYSTHRIGSRLNSARDQR